MAKIALSCILIVLSGFVLNVCAQPVQFTRLDDNITGSTVNLSDKEASRCERFLTAVFPARPMQHFAKETDKPVVRRVAYTVVEQRGKKFIIAAFTARWHAAINTLAVYRFTGDPVQLWRSAPWEATFYDMHLTTAASGSRTLVLFREGGQGASFGLSSVFYFVNGKQWLYLRDLTPNDAPVRVLTRFPLRPLMARNVRMFAIDDGKLAILLSASDEQYYLAGATPIRPQFMWRYDQKRNRLQKVDAEDQNGLTTHLIPRD